MNKTTRLFSSLCGIAMLVALTLFKALPVSALPSTFTLQIQDASRDGYCLAVSGSQLALSQSCDTNNRSTWWTFYAQSDKSYQIQQAQGSLALSQGSDYTNLAQSDPSKTEQRWVVTTEGGADDPSKINSIKSKLDGKDIGIAPTTPVIAATQDGGGNVYRLTSLRVVTVG